MKALKWIYEIEEFLIIISLIGIIGITGINVILRYAFSSPITWAEEVVLLLFVWFIFLGMSLAMKKNTHIGVDYFVMKLPKSLKLVADLFRMAVIYFVLIYIFIILALKFMDGVAGKVTPILAINYQFINVSVIVGSIFTIIHFTAQNVNKYKNHKEG